MHHSLTRKNKEDLSLYLRSILFGPLVQHATTTLQGIKWIYEGALNSNRKQCESF
jgi:hypothetical protein